MSRIGQLEQRVAERDARIAELEAQLLCPIGSPEPLVCSAGTCVECRVLRASGVARAEMKERCARIAESKGDTYDGPTNEKAIVSATSFVIADAIRSQDDG